MGSISPAKLVGFVVWVASVTALAWFLNSHLQGFGGDVVFVLVIGGLVGVGYLLMFRRERQ